MPEVVLDRFVAVDGSAASSPKRGADSIWISIDDAGRVGDPENHATRTAAFERIADLCSAPGRTLLVVDWSLGYPRGSATAFGLAGDRPSWRATWDHLAAAVEDDDENRNNRFEVASRLNARTRRPGPFWGAPQRSATSSLTVTKQPFEDVPEWRTVEQRLRDRRRWPKSCWQLGGAGSVGGQSLLGIARLAQLRDRIGRTRTVRVWPFETGLRPPAHDVDVVIAEMWPSLFVGADDLPAHWIRDAAQVDAVVRRLRVAQDTDELDDWFRPDIEDERAVVDEEGWILGVD